MANEYIHKNPYDVEKDRFVSLEEKVTNIFSNMDLLMATLANKFEPFKEVGGFNSEFGSDDKSRDIEDP
jgi:hypothetical protein